MDIHFIAGLPRSGSTLLSAILRQNPRFSAGISSPVALMYRALEEAMAQKSEGAILVSDAQRAAILRGLFDNYYGETGGIIFDTSRMWPARLPALSMLFPDARVICCVRDLGWIIDSFERLHRRNPLEPSGIYNFETTGTVYDRAVRISAGNGVVGYALNALREGMSSEQRDMMLLVEYDDLCSNPGKVMRKIYNFIEEPLFLHDFKNVEYSASEFDRNLGAKGLHDVRRIVERVERKTILPPDLFARYVNDQFWRRAA